MTRNEIIDAIRSDDTAIFERAAVLREKYYGKSVYVRGLVEFSNYCKNNCYYCGIRSGNNNTVRYRLSQDDIMDCCKRGYSLGLRTFVLQSGEDGYYDDKLPGIIYGIKSAYPGCAVTLSVGEKSREQYQSYFDAGADRFLLRHETADSRHYGMLHPPELTLRNRKKCLYTLKEIGFQVGAGFMVGSPYQTDAFLAEDILFLQQLQPEMIGIGPFIAQKDSIFAQNPNGTVEFTLKMIALARNIVPTALIPATTALGTIDPNGREKAFKAGANVVMPNLSPSAARGKYAIYDDKLYIGIEDANSIEAFKSGIEAAGYEMDLSRGDAFNTNLNLNP